MEPTIKPTGKLMPLSQSPRLTVLAFVNSEQQGHEYLQRLAQGDAGPLTELTIADVPHNYNPREREWGLGHSSAAGKFVLVVGSGDDIDWTQLPDCEPISHTHPLDTTFVSDTGDTSVLEHNVGFGQGIRLTALIDEMFQKRFTNVAFIPTMVALLPSNQDVRANYLTDPKHPERLYTPYRWNADTRTLSTTDGHLPIVIEFGPTRATLFANRPTQGAHSSIYRTFACPMTIRTTQQTIWTGWLTCGWQDMQGNLAHEPPTGARTKSENDTTLG